MGKISVGLNLEYVRHHDKPFEWAVNKAAELGYEYIEPMVHFGRELMSEAGYFHTVSLFDDPYRISRAAEKAGVKISGLQAHGPLGRPEVHGEYLKLAIRHAAECGAPAGERAASPGGGASGLAVFSGATSTGCADPSAGGVSVYSTLPSGFSIL